MIQLASQAFLSSILATLAVGLIKFAIGRSVLPRIRPDAGNLEFLLLCFREPVVFLGLALGFCSTINLMLLLRHNDFVVTIPWVSVGGWAITIAVAVVLL